MAEHLPSRGSSPGAFVLHLTAATLVAAIVLGGSSREGLPSDLLLQIIAIPLLVAALSGYFSAPRERRRWWPVVAVALLVAVPLLQLVPMPPTLWQLLPMRDLVVEAYALTGTSPDSFPLTLTPRATWLAALSLIVPISLFLGVSLLGYAERRRLIVVLIVVGTVGVALGLLQVAQGPNSELRFHAITNSDSAVGFFANRNHFATLINILTVFVGAWVVAMIAAPEKTVRSGKKEDSSRLLYVAVGLLAFVTLVAAQATSYSRAGLGLMLPALACVLSFPLARLRAGDETWSMPVRIVVATVVFAVVLALPFAIEGIANRFSQDPLADLRVRFTRNTIEAARAFMPWGAGVGSFVPIYQIFERTTDMVPNLYANRAHNDFLELWLETGVVGLSLTAAALVWLLASAYRLWLQPAVTAHPLDHFLARASLVAIALLLLHSAVDYPLRTGALMAVAGVCCGMLVRPIRDDEPAKVATAGAGVEQTAAVRRGPSWPRQPVNVAPAPGELPSQQPPVWPEAGPEARRSLEGDHGATRADPRHHGGWDGVAPAGEQAARPRSAETSWPEAWASGPPGKPGSRGNDDPKT